MKGRRSFSFSDFLFYSILLVTGLLMIFPFWNVLMSSFTTPHLVREGEMLLLPKDFSTVAYTTIFSTSNFMRVFRNTLFITVVGTVLSIVLTVMLSYALSKKRMFGSTFLLFMVFFTMLFSGGIIPLYLLVKNLGLIDTPWSLIFPNALNAFNIIVMVTFFRSIPEELEDSAKIDGANDIRILFMIIVPTSLPIIATLTLFYAVAQWNTFFHAVMFINSPDRYTLQVLLRQLLIVMTSDAVDAALSNDVPKIGVTVKLAMIIVSTVPILLVYPSLQKYFAKGVMIGSIKG
jgi:putative aldouronate transport system permease protein